MKHRSHWFVSVLLCFSLLPIASQGQWTNYFSVLDIDFDGEAYGANPQRTTPNGSPPGPFPATNLYDWSSFNTDFANSNGTTHTVGDAAVLVKAVVLSNNTLNSDFGGGGIASDWLDTQFIPARAERGVLDFDLAIMATPTSANQQVVPGTPNGQDFVINTFSDSLVRIWRFFTSHSSPTAGDIFMRLPGVTGAGTNIGTYTVGVPIHVQINADYVHDSVNVYLDGTLAIAGLPFTATRTGTNDQATEFFIFQNGVAGQLNVAALDNILYVVVPEPSAALLTFAGAAVILTVLGRYRRKSL